MAGKMCNGTTNQWDQRTIRAYAEGVEYRLSDVPLNVPITDNPHTAGTPEADSWDRGWNAADGGTIEGCVAAPTRVAPVP